MSVGIVLAIEASQRRGGVAVRDAQGAVHVEPFADELRHDDDLMPAIDRLFRRMNLNPTDLSAPSGGVAVSVGPGGFTGLRIAVTTAKMLGEALGAKLVAVPTALVAVESCANELHDHRCVLVALASKQDTIWLTMVKRDTPGSAWSIDGEPGLVDAGECQLQRVDAVVGDEHMPDIFRRRCEEAGVPIVDSRFDPAACLGAGFRMLEEGRTIDPLNLQPLYPRQPEAVTIWEQQGKQ